MSIHTQGRSRGFTLVEMSIVLVIIGLIIGGILKGQEIIASARQKAVINQVNAVRAAANTYFDRYRALPGDDPSANANLDGNVNSGDGNGIVGTALTAAGVLGNSGNGIKSENYNFFNGLVAANLLNGAQETAGLPAAFNFGTTALPAAPITGAGVTVVYGQHGGTGTNAATVRTTHWLRLHKGPSAPTAAVSPRTLANMDTQIDDGLADSGGVRGDDTATCDTQASGAYTVADTPGCVALFEVTQ